MTTAQVAPPSQPAMPNNGITLDPSTLGSLGGIGVFVYLSWQVFLKVYEKKASAQIATKSVRNEAEIDQEKQALGTLVEVFKATSQAQVEIQQAAYKDNSELVLQLSSISFNAAQARYEGIGEKQEALKASIEKLAEAQKEANMLQRQLNVALVDLSEIVKRIEWRLDNGSGRTN